MEQVISFPLLSISTRAVSCLWTVCSHYWKQHSLIPFTLAVSFGDASSLTALSSLQGGLCSPGGPGHGGIFLSSESCEQILGFKPAGRWHKQSKAFISHSFVLPSVCQTFSQLPSDPSPKELQCWFYTLVPVSHVIAVSESCDGFFFVLLFLRSRQLLPLSWQHFLQQPNATCRFCAGVLANVNLNKTPIKKKIHVCWSDRSVRIMS